MALRGELLAAPWSSLTDSFSEGSTLSFDFQSSRKIKPAVSKMTKPIKGQLLSIPSRIATVTHAANTNVAQIEFAASQKRQEFTKLDEKEGDEPLEIRLGPASAAKLSMYRLTLVATLIVVLVLSERVRFSLQAITKSSISPGTGGIIR